ncbi:MAG: amidase, partial [Verrucomicrobiales bacterium]
MNNHKLAKLTISLASISLIAGGLLYSKPKTPLPHAFITYSAPPIDGKNLRLAVKDLIDVKGQITTAGSHYLLETRAPAVKDAKCLQFARKPGVTIVGKTNLSEFAVGVTGSNDYFGTPVNPIMPDRVPGGSSSGSAVAVALGLADVALGTDTAGSIRVPAACCGVAGLKTTFGLVPIDGVYPVSPDHLDTVGPIAKDVSRLVKGMALLQEGFEDLYDEAKLARPDAKTIRIGRLNVPKTDPVIDIAIDALLIQKGFQIVQLDEDFTEAWGQAQRDGNIVAASGAWSTNEHLH